MEFCCIISKCCQQALIECNTPRHDTKSHAYRANFHAYVGMNHAYTLGMTLHVGMTSWKMDFMLSVRDHAYSTLALHLGMMSCLQLPHKDHAYSSVSCFHVMQPAF